MVHFETYKAGAFLVWQMRHAGISILEDGGDIIQAKLPSGESVSIHLIESPISLYEIKNTLTYNEKNGMHTLFLLWCDMLLPPEDHVIEPHDWEQALMALYGDRIYAYEVFGQDIFVFPVYFEPYKQYRHIRYGETVHMQALGGMVLDISQAVLKGHWWAASFQETAAQNAAAGDPKQHHARPPQVISQLSAYMMLLGVDADASAEAVKTAYRRLARQFHPDTNKEPDATAKMQALNEAYRHIMDTFDDD